MRAMGENIRTRDLGEREAKKLIEQSLLVGLRGTCQ